MKSTYQITTEEFQKIKGEYDKVVASMAANMNGQEKHFVPSISKWVFDNGFIKSGECDDIKSTLVPRDTQCFKPGDKDSGQVFILPGYKIIQKKGSAVDSSAETPTYVDIARIDFWNLCFICKTGLAIAVTNGGNLRNSLSHKTAETLKQGMDQWIAETSDKPSVQQRNQLPQANILDHTQIERLFLPWFFAHIFKIVDSFISKDGSFKERTSTQRKITWTKLGSHEVVEITDDRLIALISWAKTVSCTPEGDVVVSTGKYTDFFFKGETNFYKGYFFKKGVPKKINGKEVGTSLPASEITKFNTFFQGAKIVPEK